MPMMTASQYEESLRRLNLVVYMFGEKLENVVDDPIIRPSMLAVAKTYEMAQRPEHEDIMTATSQSAAKKLTVSSISIRAPMIWLIRAKWADC